MLHWCHRHCYPHPLPVPHSPSLLVPQMLLSLPMILLPMEALFSSASQPTTGFVSLRPLLQPPPCFQLIHCKVAVHTHVARATLPNRHHARLYRPRLPHSAYSDSHCLPSTFLFSLYLRVHLTIVLYLYHLACVLWLPSHVYKPPPSVL